MSFKNSVYKEDCRFRMRMLCSLLFLFVLATTSALAKPDSIILMIGDGMGPEHVKAGGMFAYGSTGTLVFESFPTHALVTTHCADAEITDSAAAGTAIACGLKVNKGVISRAIPGDGRDLQTILEFCADQGKSIGLVTTTYMTHATPAAFGAHADNRNDTDKIAQDYLAISRPNVLLGGGSHGMTTDTAETAGYLVVTDREGLLAIDTETVVFASGQFGGSHLPYEYDGVGDLPHLTEMTETALEILDNDPDGFFLMVEGGRIDHACHANDIERSVRETAEFDNAVRKALEWAEERDDVLVLVTADHETGGLRVISNNGAGNAPEVTWSSKGHTATPVDVYGWGNGIEIVPFMRDNTDIFGGLMALLVPDDALAVENNLWIGMQNGESAN